MYADRSILLSRRVACVLCVGSSWGPCRLPQLFSQVSLETERVSTSTFRTEACLRRCFLLILLCRRTHSHKQGWAKSRNVVDRHIRPPVHPRPRIIIAIDCLHCLPPSFSRNRPARPVVWPQGLDEELVSNHQTYEGVRDWLVSCAMELGE